MYTAGSMSTPWRLSAIATWVTWGTLSPTSMSSWARLKTSWGVPLMTTPALARTTIRSTFSATSSMLWLTMTTVVPFSL